MSDTLQSLFAGIVYWLILLSPLLAITMFAALRIKRQQPALRPSLTLLLPSALWVAFFSYAVLNQHEDVSNPVEVGRSVGAISLIVFYGTPLLAVIAVWLAKGYRKAALLVGVLNTVVGMSTALLGIMMISGNWI